MLSSLAGPPSSLRPACGRVRVRASASLQKEHKSVSILHKNVRLYVCRIDTDLLLILFLCWIGNTLNVYGLDFPFANMKSLGCILVSAPAAGALFSCPYDSSIESPD